MSSINNTRTPSPKSVSSEIERLLTRRLLSIAVKPQWLTLFHLLIPMVKTANIESLSPVSSKRSSVASPSHSSGDEGSGTESSASSKRRKIQPGKKTSGPSSRLPSPRGLISYKGVGLTSGRNGLAVPKNTEIEKHIYLDPADTTSFPAVAQEASITEPLSLKTSSSPIVSTVATPSSTVNGEDEGASALILSRPSSPIDKSGTPKYFSLATEGALRSFFTISRLADLNEMIRNIVNTKPDNNTAMVLSKDMADVLLYKDLLIKEANKHISKVEKDSQVTLEQLFFSNDAKSDLIDKARAETGRVKAELAVYIELEEKKRRYHDTWCPEDVSWSDRKQCQEQIKRLEENLAEARDEIKVWRAVFKDNSDTIGALRIRQKELLKGPSALMVESDEAKKQLDASKDEILRLRELQEVNKAEHRSLVEQLKAEHGEARRQFDAAIVKAGSYQQLQSANNAHEKELASLKEENRRMKLKLQQHVDAQAENMTRFDTLKKMLKIKDDKCEALELDFDRLKNEHDHCGDTHQRLHTQLEQGRQWANSVVNNCPFGLDRVVAAESARDTANSLRVIAELEFQILQDDNTYQKSRSMFPIPADDALPNIETHPAQLCVGRCTGLSRISEQDRRERKRVLIAAAAKKPFDANQAFYGVPCNTQMDDAYDASPLLRHSEIPESATANTTVPFPPFDNDISMRLMANMQHQDLDDKLENDDNRPDESHKASFKIEDQEDTDELPDYEHYESLDNYETIFPPISLTLLEDVTHQITLMVILILIQICYLMTTTMMNTCFQEKGCSHRRVFADGTCGSCGNKLPRPQVEVPRQARQAYPAVSVPAFEKKQSARSVKECYSSMFGGQCGGIGCTCNLARNPLPEVPTTGAPAGDTTEVPCPHNIQFMDSDSDSFDTGFRATKKAKTVATPSEHSQSPFVALSERGRTDFAPPSEHNHSGADSPASPDGNSVN
ncbi:hypothetical protein DID88_004076 [Monilinia fructigena]|uniref:Uncharacterized protein n=1 Tax=Monilinia fructigena TaxID=38457 RepID=A0A395IXC6_9HELO|nr:hypothetical protein DID88_004076 [Monilinia fructigena]